MGDHTTLGYADPRFGLSRYRRRYRLLIAAAILIAFVAVTYSNRGWIERARLVQAQQACLTYEKPTDFVCYETPAGLSVPIGSPGYVTDNSFDEESNFAPATYFGGGPWEAFCERSPPSGGTLPRAHTLVFCHERVSHAGNHFLVAVHLSPESSSSFDSFDSWFHSTTVRINGWTSPTTTFSLNNGTVRICPSSVSPTKIQVFAGQPHPTDASRFRIRYLIDGKPGTVEGIMDDSGFVWLTVTDGPGKSPYPLEHAFGNAYPNERQK